MTTQLQALDATLARARNLSGKQTSGASGAAHCGVGRANCGKLQPRSVSVPKHPKHKVSVLLYSTSTVLSRNLRSTTNTMSLIPILYCVILYSL